MRTEGFTLVEVLVAIVLVGIATLSIFQIYNTTQRYEIYQREEDYAIIQIGNVHDLFVASPDEWQTMYYDLYGYDSFTQELSEGLELYYDDNWDLVEDESQASYTMTYDYLETEDNVYTLYVDRLESRARVIIADVDLGRMGVYVG